MNRLSGLLTLFIVALLCIQVPCASPEWQPIKIGPVVTLNFPPGGGTCSTTLRLPQDSTVNDLNLNFTGKPIYRNSTIYEDSSNIWNGSTAKTNLSLRPEGIGLGGIGSWWEQEVYLTGNGSLLSTVLNISANSRVMVLANSLKWLNYSVDILDPTNGNATLQAGLENNMELSPGLWTGMPNPYRQLVMRLIYNTSIQDKAAYIWKWGVGTGVRDDLQNSSDTISHGSNDVLLAKDLRPSALRLLSEKPLCTRGSSQYRPSIALISDNDIMLTWQDDRNNGLDIYAQQYTWQGDAVGSEIPVCLDYQSQYDPRIAVDSQGNIMICWNDCSEVYTWYQTSLDAKMYNANRTPRTPQFQIFFNGYYNGDNYITTNSKDQFILAWYNSQNICGQIYDNNGNPAGALFGANSDQYCHRGPAIGVASNDEFIIARVNTQLNQGVHAQRFLSDGTMNGSDIFVLSQYIWSDFHIDIATNPNDDYVLVWNSYWWNGGTHSHVYAQIIDSTGTPKGGTIVVSEAAQMQLQPKIAMDSNGNFMVIWQDNRNGDYDIYGQLFDSGGNKIGNEISICSAPGDQTDPLIKCNSNDDFIIVWQDYRNGNWDLYSRIFAHPYLSNGSICSNPINMTGDPARELFVNATLPPGTDCWVNITDLDNNTIMPYLRNGDTMRIGSLADQTIRMNLTLASKDPELTPSVRELGIGHRLSPLPQQMLGGQYENVSASDEGVELHADTWTITDKRDLPVNFGSPSTWLVATGNDSYAAAGEDIGMDACGPNIYGYNDTTGLWKLLTTVPAEPYRGAAAWDGGDFLYILRGYNTPTFWRYSLTSNGWQSLADAPASIHSGGIVCSGDGYIYTIRGSSGGCSTRDFWRYSVQEDSWSVLAPLPVDGEAHASIVNGLNNTLFAIPGYLSDDLLEYDISGNYWTIVAAAPELLGSSMDGLVFDGHRFLYAVDGVNCVHLYRFDIRFQKFERLLAFAQKNDYCSIDIDKNGNLLIVRGASSTAFSMIRPAIYSPVGLFDACEILDRVPCSVIPSWNCDIPNGTNITVSLCFSPDDLEWSEWKEVKDGWSYCPSDFTLWGPFVQYDVQLGTVDQNITPIFQGLHIDHSCYLGSGELTGAPITVHEGDIIGVLSKMSVYLPPGASSDLFFSSDEGLAWQSIDSGVYNYLSPATQKLQWKIVETGEGNFTPLLEWLRWTYETQIWASNISIEISGDGSCEWYHTGILNGSITAGNLSAAVQKYIRVHRFDIDSEGYITVPLNITSATGGILTISGASAELSAFFPKVISYGPIGPDVEFLASVTVSFTEQMEPSSVNITVVPTVAISPAWDPGGRNLTLTHAELADNTTYRVTVQAGALSTAGGELQKALSWEFRTLLRPRVIFWSPIGDKVRLDTPLIIGFNGPMNPSSVNVTIDPMVSLLLDWYGNNDNLTMDHQDFQPDTEYSIAVEPGARFLDGTMMNHSISWKFRTVPRPLVTGFSPSGTNVRLNSSITVSFSESMNMSMVHVQCIPAISLEPVWSSDWKNMTFLHEPFTEETTFNLTISAGSCTIYGVPLGTDCSWEFTTLLIPRVVSCSPSGIDISLSAHFTIEFNKPMNLTSIMRAMETDPPITGNWTADQSGKTLNFWPGAKLLPSTDYSVTLRIDAADVEGNFLVNETEWSFVTAAARAPAPAEKAFPWWLLAVLALAVIAGSLAYYGYRRANRPKSFKKEEIAEARTSIQKMSAEPEIPAAPPEALPISEPEISIEPALEIGPNVIGVKMKIINRSKTELEDVSLKLIYDDEKLALRHFSPQLGRNGDDFILGVIEPSTVLDMEFDLEPLTISQSAIDGLLFFRHGRGRLSTLRLPVVPVDIVKPELLTDTNITIAKLLKLIGEELEFKESKLFQLSAGSDPHADFEIGKAAIQRHDVRLVKEFMAKEPFIGEAWYYGKAKNGNDTLLLRMRFLAEHNIIELMVLSNSPELLNGLLLSLKSDLIAELIADGRRPKISEVTDEGEIAKIAFIRTLMDQTMVK